ncbi:MAG TPA: gluconate 2-dehydrogenase subunit 3 family protein [Pyrinomonadaceae bacterium]|nr:gluconate 2-dehydrogenase subunit 3 family protein [Pyrinomonadaceae bacterium]
MNTAMTEIQEQTLRAAVNRIIPPDDYPGAWDAGIGDYLARQFGDLALEVDLFTAGLDALEAEALARFNSRFVNLTLDQQDTALAHIETGEVLTLWSIAPARFFELLVNTTAEGYYSEPEQGGNRAALSWAMTGFEERV